MCFILSIRRETINLWKCESVGPINKGIGNSTILNFTPILKEKRESGNTLTPGDSGQDYRRNSTLSKHLLEVNDLCVKEEDSEESKLSSIISLDNDEVKLVSNQ